MAEDTPIFGFFSRQVKTEQLVPEIKEEVKAQKHTEQPLTVIRPLYTIPRPMSPVPELKTKVKLSLKAFNRCKKQDFDALSSSDKLKVRKLIFHMMEKRRYMWKGIIDRGKKKNWTIFGAELQQRSGLAFSVNEIIKIWTRGQAELRRRLKVCIRNDRLNKSATELKLHEWELYPRIRYYRAELEEYEQTLRRRTDEAGDGIQYDGTFPVVVTLEDSDEEKDEEVDSGIVMDDMDETMDEPMEVDESHDVQDLPQLQKDPSPVPTAPDVTSESPATPQPSPPAVTPPPPRLLPAATTESHQTEPVLPRVGALLILVPETARQGSVSSGTSESSNGSVYGNQSLSPTPRPNSETARNITQAIQRAIEKNPAKERIIKNAMECLLETFYAGTYDHLDTLYEDMLVRQRAMEHQ